MAVLWRDGALAVREVASKLGGRLAYTTVMTTLDRLFKKRLLARDKVGTAFVYRPAQSRDEYHRGIAEHAMAALLARSSEPVLVGFLDAAAVDDDNLDRLAELIARRRKARK